MAKINVLNREIAVQTRGEVDFICLTDIARYKDADRTDDLIRNWLRNRNTIEFLGLWEQLNNPDFKPVEFDGFGRVRVNPIEFDGIGALCGRERSSSQLTGGCRHRLKILGC